MKTDTVLMMVTYDRLDLTKKTIEALLTSTEHPFSLVVVDNGSKDGTVEYLENIVGVYNSAPLQEFHKIFLPENKGIAIGRNLALKKADEMKPIWYCSIDNDVQMPKSWLEDSIKILQANKSYGAIGVNFEPKPYPLVTLNDCTFQDKPAGNLGTACMVFRKQLHQMIGFFNTEYNKYGLEDSDFGIRARVAGFKLGYVKQMGIHLGEDNNEVNEYRKFKTQQHNDLVGVFQRNCGLYMQKRKPIYIPFKD
ncbi:glycosyltransferase [Candidatus Pacearchaeota archaeon]|nr:glycosyltransferase [Candidatus Pacearchaeota archaeon]